MSIFSKFSVVNCWRLSIKINLYIERSFYHKMEHIQICIIFGTFFDNFTSLLHSIYEIFNNSTNSVLFLKIAFTFVTLNDRRLLRVSKLLWCIFISKLQLRHSAILYAKIASRKRVPLALVLRPGPINI